ncbi:MAG: fructosamine kinase family protein [Flavobacteriales bacterium]|jgi:fructosamine-3-kinase|nr:fructosamine kinase family protein [Flavobacteriales bacterium]MDP7430462.1 fructosamine kinase family protein [Flavobacteriales bacterium]HJN63452.1 fructosamine kinase family protein [Flavobacteriales bacterium]|tara:strand:- start:8311 stop:9168 length:858 start_codon:yes stop_codon:yes gene_type:complete
MIPSEIKRSIITQLGDALNTTITVNGESSIVGGCINNAIKINTNKGDFFVKWNTNSKANMFQSEYHGLKVLKDTNTIRIPNVLCFDDDFLILEFIPPSNPNNAFWEVFGQKLALMHKQTHSKFGLDFDNYIGSLHLDNTQNKNWTEFFIQNRLQAQLSIGNFSGTLLSDFDKLFQKLPNLFPNERPALLHGDLWSGNFLAKNGDTPMLIDPAIYYGNREMDIAMSKLFGGFNSDFYFAYNESHPLENGWEERIQICNLYPLLVHVNLFGGSYRNQVKNILSYYVG